MHVIHKNPTLSLTVKQEKLIAVKNAPADLQYLKGNLIGMLNLTNNSFLFFHDKQGTSQETIAPRFLSFVEELSPLPHYLAWCEMFL